MSSGLAPGELGHAARQLRHVARRVEDAARRHADATREATNVADQVSPVWHGPLAERWSSEVTTLVDRSGPVTHLLQAAETEAMRLATAAEEVDLELRRRDERLREIEVERRYCRYKLEYLKDPDLVAQYAARLDAAERSIADEQMRITAAEQQWRSRSDGAKRVWDGLATLLEAAARADTGSWPTMSTREREQRIAVASAIGHSRRRAVGLARDTARLLEDPHGGLTAWAALIERLLDHEDDAAFAAAWIAAVGPQRLATIPGRIEQVWRDAATDDPSRAWTLLAAVSRTFATATNREASADGVPPGFIEEMIATTGLEVASHDGPVTGLGQVALLFAAGGFSRSALLELAAVAERLLPSVARHRLRFGEHGSPWGAWGEPSATIMSAIAPSAVAAASRPKLAAQMLVSMELPDAIASTIELEVARRGMFDLDYEHQHLEELRALGVDEREVAAYSDMLLWTGHAVMAAGAAQQTVSDFQRRATTTSRDLRTGATPEIRSRAAKTLRDTPSWVAPSRTSPLYLRSGRVIPVADLLVTAKYHASQNRGAVETGLRTGGSHVGGIVGVKATASIAAPLMAAGPVVYGGAVLTGGLLGAFGGDQLAAAIYHGVLAPHHDAILWLRADDLPRLVGGAPLAATPASNVTGDTEVGP